MRSHVPAYTDTERAEIAEINATIPAPTLVGDVNVRVWWDGRKRYDWRTETYRLTRRFSYGLLGPGVAWSSEARYGSPAAAMRAGIADAEATVARHAWYAEQEADPETHPHLVWMGRGADGGAVEVRRMPTAWVRFEWDGHRKGGCLTADRSTELVGPAAVHVARLLAEGATGSWLGHRENRP